MYLSAFFLLLSVQLSGGTKLRTVHETSNYQAYSNGKYYHHNDVTKRKAKRHEIPEGCIDVPLIPEYPNPQACEEGEGIDPGTGECASCDGFVPIPTLVEGKCIICPDFSVFDVASSSCCCIEGAFLDGATCASDQCTLPLEVTPSPSPPVRRRKRGVSAVCPDSTEEDVETGVCCCTDPDLVYDDSEMTCVAATPAPTTPPPTVSSTTMILAIIGGVLLCLCLCCLLWGCVYLACRGNGYQTV